MNLTELLDNAASRWPGKPAIIEGDTVLSYSELVADIAAWAAQLKAHGNVRHQLRVGENRIPLDDGGLSGPATGRIVQ